MRRRLGALVAVTVLLAGGACSGGDERAEPATASSTSSTDRPAGQSADEAPPANVGTGELSATTRPSPPSGNRAAETQPASASATPVLPRAGTLAYWYDEKKTTRFLDNEPVVYPGGRRSWTLTIRSDGAGRRLEWSHNGGRPDDPPGGSLLSVQSDDITGVFPAMNVGGPGFVGWSPPVVLVPHPLEDGQERRGTSRATYELYGTKYESTFDWTVRVTGRRTVRLSGQEWQAWTLHRTWTKHTTKVGCTPAPDHDCKSESTATSDEVYVPELGIVDTTGHEEFKSETSSGVIDYRLYVDGIDV